MISPSAQWAHQIAVTSLCWPKNDAGQKSACSNCTRLLGHERRRYYMTAEHFERCAEAAKDFPTNSDPNPSQGRKVIGIFGGEPLLSPLFPEYVEILCDKLPDPRHRGLWTSFDWKTYEHPRYGAARPHVERLLAGRGYLNWNQHVPEKECAHQPVLVSIEEVVPDKRRRWRLIEDCWVQRIWSGAYAYDAHNEPKFYFCEVAASFDRVFDLGTGITVEPGCWRGEIRFEADEHCVRRPVGKFAEQIVNTCGRCGASLPMQARRDREWKDDISPDNLAALRAVGSPMVAQGDFVEFGPEQIAAYKEEMNRPGWKPNKYLK